MGRLQLRESLQVPSTVWQEPCMHTQWGHTTADTPEKLSEDELRRSAICTALLLHQAASADDWLPTRITPEQVERQSGCSAEEIRNRREDQEKALIPSEPVSG